jgi:tRNA G18 (ribose-2'-O)-methylase SpoU
MNKKLKLDELNRISVDDFKSIDKTPINIILDDIRSLNNIGSVFRTSDAFRVKKIYLCGITATPPHREIQKTALGATESVEWEHRESVVDLVKELQINNIEVISIEQTEDKVLLNEYQKPSKEIALVFGNEVDGVNQEVINLSDSVIEIPQFGTKHSFNISVSAGIVLWDIYNKICN